MPVSVNVKPEPPAVAEIGVIDVSVGKGLVALAVNVCADDVPPPGIGLNTVTDAVPALAMSGAGTDAVSEVALTNVVVRAVPFHFTTEVLTKFVPASVSVNAVLPSSPEAGAIEVNVGKGLLMVNIAPVSDVPPPGPGLFTLTVTVPPVAISEAGTVAVKEVLLTKVVVRGVLPQFTTEVLTKLTPVTVMVNPGSPAIAEFGETEVTPGEGLLMEKVNGEDVPPPGVGLNTVIGTVPVVAMSPAGTAAVIDVALTNVVVRAVPFHCTTEPLTNFVPVTLSWNPAPPKILKVGKSDVIVGTGLAMTSVNTADALPEKLASPP